MSEVKTPADRLWDAAKELDRHHRAASIWGSLRISRVVHKGDALFFMVHCEKPGDISHAALFMGHVFTEHLQKDPQFSVSWVVHVSGISNAEARSRNKRRLRVDGTHKFLHAFLAVPKGFFNKRGLAK